jgi:hypothetical protein
MPELIGKYQFKEFQRFMSYAIVYDLVCDFPDVGGKVWSIRNNQPWPRRTLKAGDYLYVLMPDGELRIPQLPHTTLDMHHPELARRKPVIGAGVLGWSGTDITCIDNKSGCYTPDTWSIWTVICALKFYSVPLNPHYKSDPFVHY